jgi:hypothetical protein
LLAQPRLPRRSLAEPLLHVKALAINGRIDAVLGDVARRGTITAPLFGYDLGLPKELGLYRRLCTLISLEAQARRDTRHLKRRGRPVQAHSRRDAGHRIQRGLRRASARLAAPAVSVNAGSSGSAGDADYSEVWVLIEAFLPFQSLRAEPNPPIPYLRSCVGKIEGRVRRAAATRSAVFAFLRHLRHQRHLRH